MQTLIPDNSSAVETIGVLWCSLMHDSPMWPIHGEYECRDCGRRYSIPWAAEKSAPPVHVHAGAVTTLRRAA